MVIARLDPVRAVAVSAIYSMSLLVYVPMIFSGQPPAVAIHQFGVPGIVLLLLIPVAFYYLLSAWTMLWLLVFRSGAAIEVRNGRLLILNFVLVSYPTADVLAVKSYSEPGARRSQRGVTLTLTSGRTKRIATGLLKESPEEIAAAIDRILEAARL